MPFADLLWNTTMLIAILIFNFADHVAEGPSVCTHPHNQGHGWPLNRRVSVDARYGCCETIAAGSPVILQDLLTWHWQVYDVELAPCMVMVDSTPNEYL